MQKLKSFHFSFWTFQIAGWLMIELVVTFRLFFGESLSGKDCQINYFLLVFSLDCVSFLITVGFRYLYHWLMAKELSFISLLFIGVGISFLAAMVPIPVELFLRPIYKLESWENYSLLRTIYSATWNFPIFFGWSLLYFGIKIWMKWSAGKENLAKANFLAQSAQLQMLRYQLNPHFLFNSLNSIWALIDEDKKASKEMVSELAEFLRYSLMSKNYSDVPLRQEIEATRHYLSI